MAVSFITEDRNESSFYATDEEWFKTLPSGNNQFTVGHLNVRSLPLHFENMCATLRHTLKNADLLALSETFLTEEKMRSNNYNIPDYQIIEKHRKEGKQGGILSYVKSKYAVEEEEINLREYENLFLKITVDLKCVVHVLIIYRPQK